MDFLSLTDYFDLLGVVGKGSFGTVIHARTLDPYASATKSKGTSGSTIPSSYVPHDVALKKLSLSCGSSIRRELHALHAVKGCSNVVELVACVGNVDGVSGITKALSDLWL